ncbi:hypothetical protein DFR49_3867 [Hephaestia caeni]|uniref:Enoyl reductase (ER) domain-containing protein n=1 Tax=Hephaestia caeni TaxID=645617 RepID=A0A397NS16_9SPHN|nr:NADP-dependent oxidoreductase [Hephaestia caeni]RIA37977.1 hypothetical protein DFR49_3867 [Hephaestia caeni]
MAELSSREIQLGARPTGRPSLENFVVVEKRVADPAPGEVRVRNLWMSVDPYMGNRLYDRPNYIPPFRLDHPLDGGAVGEVLESTVPDFTPGDLVFSQYGWREIFNAKPHRLTRLEGTLPPQAHLGIAGITGMTAYTALYRVAKLQPGETVYISAAAGAVGSTACQMAKIDGCRVIGSAGGPDKKRFLEELGVDVAIDYKAEPDLSAALAAAAPDGINVYLDNVGGDHLQAALTNMAVFGRIAVSGMIGDYGEERRPGPSNLFMVVAQRLRMEGFLLNDHAPEIRETFLDKITRWLADGSIQSSETIHDGITSAPQAFLDLFAGKNVGKMLVKLG